MSAAPTVTALAVVPRPDTIEPRSMAELQALAAAAAKTGFFGAKSPEQALLICMSGRDLGLSYSQSLRAFHVIEGRPSLSADGMVAACLMRRDVCEFFRTIESTNERATVETKRAGQEPQRYSFSIADAQRAELAGRANWKRYPSRMLLARARAALARDVYPDLLLGLYDPDELADVTQGPRAVAVEARTVTEDGEVVERSLAVQAAVSQARAAVDAAPPVDGPSDDAKKLAEDFLACGSAGTQAQYRALCSRAAKLGNADKLHLSAVAKAAKAAIEARNAAELQAELDAQTSDREPGEEG